MPTIMTDVLGVILGGGAGSRLYPLTKLRAKPAVPLAGHYRLIDIPLSNCIHSGINRVYVLTQFNSVSLHRHISRTYQFDNFSGGWVQILAAQQTPESESWYQGTADALRQQLYQIRVARPHDVLILSGDHLYRMDYARFIHFHRQKEADITIAVKPATAEEAPRLGILQLDEDGRIQRFREKPPATELVGLESVPGDKPYMASMGIYVFRAKTLADVLSKESGSDFGKHIIPAAIEKGLRVYGYQFDGYWEDIGTIKSFYEVNLALAQPNAPFDIFDAEWPIYTRSRYLPGTLLADCDLHNVLLGHGSIIEGAEITDSVIGLRSTIRRGAHLRHVVMMGGDYYETPAEKAENRALGLVDVGVGEGSVIERAILDKNARIGRNVVIRDHTGMPDEDTESYVVRDGIVVIPKNASIPDGTVI